MRRTILIILVALVALSFYGCVEQTDPQENGAADPDDQGGVSAFARIEQEETIEEESPPAKTPSSQYVTIAAVGDVMLMSTQIYDAKTEDGFDFNPVFSLITPYIEQADIAVANLETPVAGNELGFSVSGELKEDGTRGYSYFNAPPEILDALRDAGLDILGTANNHALDKDKEGLENTISAVRAAGLACVGTNLPEEDKQAIVQEVNGISVAFLAYTSSVNGHMGGYSGNELAHAVNFINEDTIIEDIGAVKQAGADIVVLCLHTGEERTQAPTWDQEEWAEAFVAAGADILFYSHPHVLQPMEWVTAGENGEERTGFAAYSLGNFISNMDGDDCARSAVVYVDIVKDETGVYLEGARYLPTYFYRTGGEYIVLPAVPSALPAIREAVGESAANTAEGAYERTTEFLGSDEAMPER